MFLDNLLKVYQKNRKLPPLLLRNLLKETVQFYVLNFIYNSIWGEKLVMKGGTCLRFCFELPRLSEDLDFDVEDYKNFDVNKFADDLLNFFSKTLQFRKVSVKLAGNKRTVYLKFPILTDLGFSVSKGESNIIHVRIDITPCPIKNSKIEISLKSTYDFTFLIRRYSLPDLFAGKIAAILTRETIEGVVKTERVKGRDYYDLIWFSEKGVIPNWNFLEKITKFKRKDAVRKLEGKTKEISLSFLRAELLPFFVDSVSIENFCKNFQLLAENCLRQL